MIYRGRGVVMKIKARYLMVASIIAIFSCVVVPVVNAETLDIGTKVAESDPDSSGYQWYYFDSGCMIRTKPDYIDYVPLIFDGNESTGIDHNFSTGHDSMVIYLVFPDSYYVNNITFKPVFGGNASEYNGNQLIHIGSVEFWFSLPFSEEKTIHINGTIDSLRLWLDSNGTNHFYFNDVIINYTSGPSIVDELQDQINNLTEQLILIDNTINQLNNSINELNQTQKDILENVTNLSASYNQLNESFTNLINDIDNLDSRVFQLESENAAFRIEIENLTLEIENLTSEIENLTSDLENLDSRVFQLESENAALRIEIKNFTSKIENLTLEIENLTSEIENLTSDLEDIDYRLYELESENAALRIEIENFTSKIENLTLKIENLTSEIETLKTTERERIIEKQPDNSLVYAALILGILGIIIALVAIIMLSKKLGSHPRSREKEESKDLTNP